MLKNIFKNKLMIGFICLLALGLLSISGLAINQSLRKKEMSKSGTENGVYVQKQIIFALWGSDKGRIGLYEENMGAGRTGEDSFFRGGPTNIAFDKNSNIYIGDSVNKRIVKFDNKGQYLTSILVAKDDNIFLSQFQVEDGDIYVLETIVNERKVAISHTLQQYNDKGKVINSNQLSEQIDFAFGELHIRNGNIYMVDPHGSQLNYIGSKSEIFSLSEQQRSYRGIPMRDGITYLYYGPTDDDKEYRIRLFDKFGAEKDRVNIQIPRGLVAIDTDKEDSIYLIADLSEHPYTDSNPRIEIYKYTRDGVLLANIKSYGEYWTLTRRKVEIDDSGNIYHFLTKKDGVYVIKWEKTTGQ